MNTVGSLYIKVANIRKPEMVICQIIAYNRYIVYIKYVIYHYPITGDNSSYRNK